MRKMGGKFTGVFFETSAVSSFQGVRYFSMPVTAPRREQLVIQHLSEEGVLESKGGSPGDSGNRFDNRALKGSLREPIRRRRPSDWRHFQNLQLELVTNDSGDREQFIGLDYPADSGAFRPRRAGLLASRSVRPELIRQVVCVRTRSGAAVSST